eukprot:scaffold18898_cov116-Isochrysis_galbana.AAC.2
MWLAVPVPGAGAAGGRGIAMCLKLSTWLSGIAGAKSMALWLTILPCAGSRGRFGDDWIPISMSVGPEAEGAARASAGVCSMLNQK